MSDAHLVPDVEPPRQKRPRETKRGGLWVNDKELIERLNVDEAKARAVLRELDADKIIPHREVLPANGPVIIDQHRGIPYYADDFRAEWRKLAAECGVPLNVQNRDSRAGAISEAIAMGANAAHVRDAATHSSVEQTYEYSRAGRENTATVQELRARKSKKNVA